MSVIHLIISLLLCTHLTYITAQTTTAVTSIDSIDSPSATSSGSLSSSDDSNSTSADSSSLSSSDTTSNSTSSDENTTESDENTEDSVDDTADDDNDTNSNSSENTDTNASIQSDTNSDDGTDTSDEEDEETDETAEIDENNAESIESETGGAVGGRHGLDSNKLDNSGVGNTKLGLILGIVFTGIGLLIIGIIGGFLYLTKWNGFKTDVNKLDSMEMMDLDEGLGNKGTNDTNVMETKNKYDTNNLELMNDSIDDLITVNVDEENDGIDRMNRNFV